MQVAPALGCVAVVTAIACQGGRPSTVAKIPDAVDRLARTCAKVASCSHAHEAPRQRDPSACVDAWIARTDDEGSAFADCVAKARGCDGVDACSRGKVDIAAAAYCKAHAGSRTACDGNHLVTCSDDDSDESTSVDCGAFGAGCGASKQPGGLVSLACLSSSLCPSNAPEIRCDGDHALIGCHDGAAERTECSPPTKCEEHHGVGPPTALCESSGHRHCDKVGTRWCERGLLVSCVPHGPLGQTNVTDCAAAGLACAEAAEEGASCTVLGPGACRKGPSRCEGSSLAFCAAGSEVRVSCQELGFATCDPDGHGVDAACATPGPGL